MSGYNCSRNPKQRMTSAMPLVGTDADTFKKYCGNKLPSEGCDASNPTAWVECCATNCTKQCKNAGTPFNYNDCYENCNGLPRPTPSPHGGAGENKSVFQDCLQEVAALMGQCDPSSFESCTEKNCHGNMTCKDDMETCAQSYCSGFGYDSISCGPPYGSQPQPNPAPEPGPVKPKPPGPKPPGPKPPGPKPPGPKPPGLTDRSAWQNFEKFAKSTGGIITFVALLLLICGGIIAIVYIHKKKSKGRR